MSAPAGTDLAVTEDVSGLGACGLADGIGQGFEIVAMRDRRRELTNVAHDLPAARNSEPDGVFLA